MGNYQKNLTSFKFQGLSFKIRASLMFLLCVVSALPTLAGAASFSISPQDLAAGKETEIVLSLDTENQEINAISLHLKFSSNDFLVEDISDGNSIINLWIEKPVFSNEKGEIALSGIIPGGFQGASGQLLKIILSPQKSGEASFEISEAKVLLNDGKGTSANLSISNFQFSISEKVLTPQIPIPEIKDTEPPETFQPEIAQDAELFNGKYFWVFATQDKQSGIDHYEIKEVQQRFEFGNLLPFVKYFRRDSWIASESPYLLQNQDLDEKIVVKAVDKSGNERVATIPAQKPRAWYKDYANWIMIIVVIILAAFIKRNLWKKLLLHE